jgi:hypothetical protein
MANKPVKMTKLTKFSQLKGNKQETIGINIEQKEDKGDPLDINIEIDIGDEQEQPVKGRFSQKIVPRQQLAFLCEKYMRTNAGKYNEFELEAKFGTRGIKPISKNDYDNVIKKLKSLGYDVVNPEGSYTLKIQPEILDIKTGQYKITRDLDRFRVELSGMQTIQEYCKSNNLQQLLSGSSQSQVKIMKKGDVKEGDQYIQSANFDDFNFRVSYKNEESVSKNSKIALDLISKWNESQKIFRYVNRVTFTKQGSGVQFDLSIVKSSSKDERGNLTKAYNVQSSNVFNNPESYEIEVEALSVLKTRIIFESDPLKLMRGIENATKTVLSGLQKTNYPISYPKQRAILDKYMKVCLQDEFKKQRKEYVPKERIYPSDFIGPSSKTLQIKNIGPINFNINVPNITVLNSYCVTDKADGDRHLLFVDENGEIYLINTNMNVIFTGARTEEEKCKLSIIDGELILHNKTGRFINTFAAFDAYFINGTDVRSFPFIAVNELPAGAAENGARLAILKAFIKSLKPESILAESGKKDSKDILAKYSTLNPTNRSPITIISKNFYPHFTEVATKEDTPLASSYNIYEACRFIMQRVQDNLFDYRTDGLIFTPTMLGVGSTRIGEAGPLRKVTWEYSFKWKPSEFNTIDFLITTRKGADGKDIITPIFENGINIYEATQYNQYKTLVLRVGYDEKKHGYLNPCSEMLEGKSVTDDIKINERSNYKPVQFYPTNPYDTQAGLCNIMMELDATGNYQMFTEERHIFEDNTIVEFRYDMKRDGLWKWVPLRVRYDKTFEYRQGLNNFGNDYTTANNNWHSIHNPITLEMITTGEEIPEEILADDIYYNQVTSDKLTVGMRDFHNLVVKRLLIQGVSSRGDTLIDYACGKGGDLPKWVANNLSFVLGIDISRDNLENRLNGSCARYLNFKKDFKKIPEAIFLCGNSSMNIRSGKAMETEKASAIIDSIFANKPKDGRLGAVVEKNYGVGRDGFRISSCQFAMHYMFQNNKVFYNFLRNLAECTQLNGYFIGTCYDGNEIFQLLKKKELGESLEIFEKEKKVWSVSKGYSSTEFTDNEGSLGYAIDVFQDSINRVVTEYLVQFDFFIREMEKYGFVLITRDEAKSLNLPTGMGSFLIFYQLMMEEIKRNPSKEKEYGQAVYMRQYEKDISFLNKFFVFKKIRTIDALKLTNAILGKLPDQLEFEIQESQIAQQAAMNVLDKRPKGRNLKKKLLLIEATEGKEEKAQEKETDIQASEIVMLKPTVPRKLKRKVVNPIINDEPIQQGPIITAVETEQPALVLKPKKQLAKAKIGYLLNKQNP